MENQIILLQADSRAVQIRLFRSLLNLLFFLLYICDVWLSNTIYCFVCVNHVHSNFQVGIRACSGLIPSREGQENVRFQKIDSLYIVWEWRVCFWVFVFYRVDWFCFSTLIIIATPIVRGRAITQHLKPWHRCLIEWTNHLLLHPWIKGGNALSYKIELRDRCTVHFRLPYCDLFWSAKGKNTAGLCMEQPYRWSLPANHSVVSTVLKESLPCIHAVSINF